MADMITRCPKCGTAFRISDALLKSAKGVVRCGSCLSVFNARDHLEAGRTAPVTAVRQPTSIAPTAPKPAPSLAQRDRPAPPRPQSTPPPPPVEETFQHSDVDEREDEVDMPEWRRRSAEEDPFDVAKREREQELDEDEDDEAWALELLKDDDDLNVQFKKVTPKSPPKPPAAASRDLTKPAAPAEPPLPLPTAPPAPRPTAFAQPEEEEPEGEPLRPGLGAAPAESEREELDDVHDSDHALESHQVQAGESGEAIYPREAVYPRETVYSQEAVYARETTYPSEATDSHEALHQALKVTSDEEEQEPDSAPPPPEPAKRKPIRPKLEPKSTPLKDVIASLEPEPLEVDWQEPGAWRRRLLWPLLALVALLCLLAQVAWLEFDRLSRIEPYRSVYGVACRYIGCQLPELLDLSQIHTSNLLVRSHPDVADALQVDVILQNNAPFEQSFPILELTFTNLRSEPVATRQLKPAEYLGGELAGRDKMPIRQPIHIALEIADPGKDAVSYHISIVE